MKKNNLYRVRFARLVFAALLFFVGLSPNISQQYPLSVTTFLQPPYPVRFEDYLNLGNQVIVTVKNTSGQPYTFNFSIRIEGPNNLIIQRSPLFKQPFTIGPYQSKSLQASEWNSANLLFTTNDIQPPSERQFIIQNRVLREGNYTICLQAIDAQTGQPLSTAAAGLNCTSFTANYGAPPIIISPKDNQVLPLFPNISTVITWVQNNLTDPSKVRYRVKIIDLTQAQIHPNAAHFAMNNPGIQAFYEKDNIQGFTHVLQGEPFRDRHKYAVRVTSYDPQNKMIFQNGGHSDVVVFEFSKYASECTNMSAFQAKSIYPLANDTLPFLHIPMLVQFSPPCELYNKFEYRLSVDGQLQQQHTVPWPQGALKFVQNKYNNVSLTWNFASFQSLGRNKTPFQRGKTYEWEAQLTVSDAKGKKWQSNTSKVAFVAGMPRPRQVFPAPSGQIPKGKVVFRWRVRSGNNPLLPFFALKAFDSNGQPLAADLASVKERWVIQIFKSKTTDTTQIVFQNDSLITLDPSNYLDKKTLKYNFTKFQEDFERLIATVANLPNEGTYYWRVGWLRNPELSGKKRKFSDSELYHATDLRKVLVVSTGAEEDEDCVASCDAPPITDRSPAPGLKAKDTLQIGQFKLVVTSVTNSSGNTFSGEGYIPVSFLKDWPIKVKFKNIKKNKAGQIFAGSIDVVKDKDFITQSQATQIGSTLGLSADLAKSLGTFLNQGGRLINSAVRKNKPIGLPIGIDNTVEGNKIVVAILDMKFTTKRATLTAVVNLDIPALNPYRANVISMGVKDLCFGPEGTASTGIALLPRDIVIDIDDPQKVPKEEERTQLVIKSSLNATDPKERTEVVWNCKGFKHVNLSIEVRFSRKVILPDGPNGKPGTGRVVASAYLKGSRGLNFIGKLQMRDFQIPVKAMEGYAFKVKDAWIDLSNVENPPELVSNLPQNYKEPNLQNTDQRVQSLWRGFWLKEVSVKLPQYIGNINNEQERYTQISAHNIIIDKKGFTAAFLVKGLIKWESPNNKPKHIDGVRFSLDSLWVNVMQNSLTEAGLSGKLGIPFAERHDYLHYRGVLDHNSKATQFDFNVTVADSLEIPIFFAQAKLKKNSYVKFGLGSANYVSFDLNAVLNIIQDSFNINAPGLHIEHLRYHSTTGFDNSNFRFAVASPQKWFANFPISFDNFNITGGNAPVVSWEMTVAFQGSAPKKKGQSKNNKTKDKGKKKKENDGQWGLSGTVGLAIHNQLGTGEGLWDKIKGFEVKEVRLKKIAIDAEVSSVKIKGIVEFYKDETVDGFRGNLDVELPAKIKASLEGEFGTYKKKGAKTFNTADWYSYWRIGGTVILGEAGVPLFAGLTLYGLGGGVYYHMTRTAELPSLVASKTPQKKGEKKSAYKPDFDTALGLQFAVLMGSEGGGKAYNFSAKLEAAFSQSGGLSYLGITGDMKAMCEGLDDNSPKVGGWVKIEYHKATEKEFVQGRLYVTVNAGIIKGSAKIPDPPKEYKGDKSNAFVWAEFYADLNKDYWYFNMGTPKNRGALSVTFDATKKDEDEDKDKDKDKDKNKTQKDEDEETGPPTVVKAETKFTAYLMIGHEVPSILPPPDQTFMKIWAQAGGGKNDFSGGKVSEFIKGKPRPPLPPGKGFAFGASLSIDVNAEIIPFYFDLSMALGFDINVTHNLQRRCYIPSRGEVAPGIDGWYALGQIYAGAYAAFGIKVDLWFINGKFEIFKGAAALLLQGGFPNPNWVEGRGRLSYSILNGFIKGQCAFDVRIGEKCDPTVPLSQLLDQIAFIQDLKPADKAKDVDVFTSLSATFAFPINRVLEIPEKDSTIRRIVPVISTWTLKDKNGKLMPVEDILYTNDNVAAVLNTKVVLSGETRYTTYLEVKARELLGGGRWVYVQKNGRDWTQSKTHTFVTGKAPDVIPEKNVLFTWPLANQRYFLKGETEGGKWGYIVLDKGMRYLFKDRAKYDYIVRFTRLDGSEHTLDVSLFPENYAQVLRFNVSRLENGKRYAMQVIEVDKALKQKLQQQLAQQNQQAAGGITTWTQSTSGANQLAGPLSLNTSLPLAQALQLREETINLIKGNGNGSTLTSDVIKKRELPGAVSRYPAERVLYNYYFGTSKYDTYKEKVGSSVWKHQRATFFLSPGYLSEITLDEEFEQYDKEGYTHNGYRVAPLLQVYLNGYNSRFTRNGTPTNIYLKTKVDDNIRGAIVHINSMLKTYQTGMRLIIREPKMELFVSFNNASQWASPLQRSELITSNNSSPGSTSTQPLGGGLVGITGGPIVGLGANIVGGITSSLQPPNYKLAIGYHPTVGGWEMLTRAQKRMSALLDRYLDFPCKYGAHMKADWPKVPHWWYRYFKKPKVTYNVSPSGTQAQAHLGNDFYQAFDKYLRSEEKCLSGPTLRQFFSKIGFLGWVNNNLLQPPSSIFTMSYSPARPHSFIIQYRYPTPKSRTHSKSNKKMSSVMSNGTWQRVEIKP